MIDPHITIPIARGVEDLIPAFMKNRAEEIESLREALDTGDFEQLARLGHRMKGVGEPYGFDRISDLGRKILEAAGAGDGAALADLIGEYADYLARVRVVYR